MPLTPNAYLVDTDWLQQHLDAPDLVIFDASWHLPGSGRDAKAEHLAEHIPGAHFFDIDDISDDSTDLPHMLPSTVKFASRMKAMGVGDGQSIVIYDSQGLFSAPRAWWTLRAMGHKEVAVLNGGLKKWKAEGRPVEDGGARARSPRHFTPRFNAQLVRDLSDMKAGLSNKAEQIVDARPLARFTGEEGEPRDGLRQGHIPGSRSVCFQDVVSADGTLKSGEELTTIFKAAGIDPAKPVITTCGSGVTASILALALAVTGQPNAAVYDGSWAEWGASDGPEIDTGPA